MIELLLTSLTLSTIPWVAAAHSNVHFYKKTCTPSNPYRVAAEKNLRNAMVSLATCLGLTIIYFWSTYA